MKQSPIKKKIIVILENLEKSSLSELLGDFLAPLENRSTESPCIFQKGKGWREHINKPAVVLSPGVGARLCFEVLSLLFRNGTKAHMAHRVSRKLYSRAVVQIRKDAFSRFLVGPMSEALGS